MILLIYTVVTSKLKESVQPYLEIAIAELCVVRNK